MTAEQKTFLKIKEFIASLPAEDAEAVEELAQYLRMLIKRAGGIVGPAALALVGSEAAAQATES